MAAKVLVVDDLEFMRDAIGEILQSAGFDVVAEAENGRIAVDQYVRRRPDVVLLDITMPEMDGIEALKQIRAIDSRAAVIMCSALGQQKHIIRSIQLGARDFIVKPFKPERIVSAVRKVVRRYG